MHICIKVAIYSGLKLGHNHGDLVIHWPIRLDLVTRTMTQRITRLKVFLKLDKSAEQPNYVL